MFGMSKALPPTPSLALVFWPSRKRDGQKKPPALRLGVGRSGPQKGDESPLGDTPEGDDSTQKNRQLQITLTLEQSRLNAIATTAKS